MGETEKSSKIFEFIRSAFWGLFSTRQGEIDDGAMEYYGEKTRNALYTGYGMSRKGGRHDYNKLELFKRGFNRPVPGLKNCKGGDEMTLEAVTKIAKNLEMREYLECECMCGYREEETKHCPRKMECMVAFCILARKDYEVGHEYKNRPGDSE